MKPYRKRLCQYAFFYPKFNLIRIFSAEERKKSFQDLKSYGIHLFYYGL